VSPQRHLALDDLRRLRDELVQDRLIQQSFSGPPMAERLMERLLATVSCTRQS
jgi:hypothetical protein